MKKRSHILYFDKDYSNSEFVECNKGYSGYKEDDEVNDWLSEIFDEPVFLLRSQKDRLTELDKSRLPAMTGHERKG